MVHKTVRDNGFEIEEIGTDKYPSLEAAQEAALPVLADALTGIIRSGLDNGPYIVENGVIRLREEVTHE